MYDTSNIFAKILRVEIPNNTIYENEYVLAFYDIDPVRKVHAIVIPKGNYIDYTDFITKATADEILQFNAAVVEVARITNIADSGYRIISNIGTHSGQEVPHLHFHIIGGETIGALVEK
jgi:histidine triad (HIT) family protein